MSTNRKQAGNPIGLLLRDKNGELKKQIQEALARGEKLYIVGPNKKES